MIFNNPYRQHFARKIPDPIFVYYSINANNRDIISNIFLFMSSKTEINSPLPSITLLRTLY